jgi:hypothetical protein
LVAQRKTLILSLSKDALRSCTQDPPRAIARSDGRCHHAAD